MGRPAAVSLDALRERIRELEGNRVRQIRTPTGIGALDSLIGGLPTPGVLELAGRPGSGRTRFAAALAAACTARERPVAWLDPTRRLHPPALAALGVDLERLLLVQPPAGREGWAIEQVTRSGAFPLVIVSDPPTRGRAGQRWALASEAGHCTLIVLGEHPSRFVPACVRLAVGGGRLTVTRDRNAPPGHSADLPPWPDRTCPWG